MAAKTGTLREILEATKHGQKYLKSNHKLEEPAPEPEEICHQPIPEVKSNYVLKEDLEND